MKKEIKEAFKEVYEVIKLMPEELKEKIPEGFKELIKNEMALDYYPNIVEPIENFEFRKETVCILGMIYRDFLSSQDEKARLQMEEAEEYKKYMETNNIQTSGINYSEKLREINSSKSQKENEPNIYTDNQEKSAKEGWYQKILKSIKKD